MHHKIAADTGYAEPRDAAVPECPPDDMLVALARGKVGPKGWAYVEEHLARCEGCAAAVALVARYFGRARDSTS